MSWASGELSILSTPTDPAALDAMLLDAAEDNASMPNVSVALRLRRRLRRLAIVQPGTPPQLVALVNTLLTLATTLGLGLVVQLLVLICWSFVVNRKYYRQQMAAKASGPAHPPPRGRRRWLGVRSRLRGTRRVLPAPPEPAEAARRYEAEVASTDVHPVSVIVNRHVPPSPPPTPPETGPPPVAGTDLAALTEGAPSAVEPPPAGFMPFPKLFMWPNVVVVILAMFASGLTKASVTILAAQPEGCDAGCFSAAISTISCVVALLLLLAADLLVFRRRFQTVTFKKAPRATQTAQVDDPCMVRWRDSNSRACAPRAKLPQLTVGSLIRSPCTWLRVSPS